MTKIRMEVKAMKKIAGRDAAEYMREYIAAKIVYRKANFAREKPEDMMLLEWIDAQPEGTSPYLKRLVLADMLAKKQP